MNSPIQYCYYNKSKREMQERDKEFFKKIRKFNCYVTYKNASGHRVIAQRAKLTHDRLLLRCLRGVCDLCVQKTD